MKKAVLVNILRHSLHHVYEASTHILIVYFKRPFQSVNATLYSNIELEGVFDMTYRKRIKYSSEQKKYMDLIKDNLP